MKRTRVLATLLLLMVVSLSISIAVMRKNETHPSFEYPKMETTTAMLIQSLQWVRTAASGGSDLLNSSTRLEIYNYILDNPGVHFRGICRGLGMPVGVVQYHLRLLTGSDLITSHREKRYKRYFEQGKFTTDRMGVISTLRNETARMILSTLLEEPLKPHGELASELGMSSQALTWQMNRLKELGLVEAEEECRNVSYSLCCDRLSTIEECLELLERRK